MKETIDGRLLNSLRSGAMDPQDSMLPFNEQDARLRDQPENDYIPRIQTPWLKYDRMVLRFEAYFQEHVVESPNENFRIRKCLIYYYLTDNTIHVNEPKIENSGLPQGILIRRMQIPKDIKNLPRDYFSWEDLAVGKNVTFFEHTFHIINCDAFTRAFYAEKGIPLAPAERLPEDGFSYSQKIKNVRVNPPDFKELKEYNEVKVKNGGGHPNGGLKKYLENDRIVLCFDIMWHDKTLCGGVNFYKMNYFLADDSVEVKEIKKQNSGKDGFPLLLKRSKLPKDPFLTHYPGMSLKKSENYGPQDLTCGKVINIFGRECVIYDCDEFTKRYYREVFGYDQIPVPLTKGSQTTANFQIPPHNGIGSEEDSLQNCFSLQPKPPRKDLNKMFNMDQYILRFDARMISENREDNNRTFILSFFCGDDSIQVYLVTERNSGVQQGKYLERRKHKNPKTSEYYNENDLQIGNVLTLNNQRFQLLKPDVFSENYMKERPLVFPQIDGAYVLDKLRQRTRCLPRCSAVSRHERVRQASGEHSRPCQAAVHQLRSACRRPARPRLQHELRRGVHHPEEV